MKKIIALVLMVFMLFSTDVSAANPEWEEANKRIREATMKAADEFIEWTKGNLEVWEDDPAGILWTMHLMVERGYMKEEDIRKAFGEYKPYDFTPKPPKRKDYSNTEQSQMFYIYRYGFSGDPSIYIDVIRKFIDAGYITKDDIAYEFGIERPASPKKPVHPSGGYASLEILDHYGYYLTMANGHYYSIDREYDAREQMYTYVLEEDNKTIYRFEGYTWAPRGVIQINSVVYIAMVDSILKYSDGKVSLLTDKFNGTIEYVTDNGKDIYISVNTESNPSGRWYDRYYHNIYYKVSTDGNVTKLPGVTTPTDYLYSGFAVNKDGDRLAMIPLNDSGTLVRNILPNDKFSGREYFQRVDEEDDPHAIIPGYTPEGGSYCVNNVLYVNNCLVVNVNGSLVCYDSDNKPRVIMGNMKGSRLWRESYIDTPGELYPTDTGRGDKVAIAYVESWSVGDDGCIYGRTMRRWDQYYNFKLQIPKEVKEITTYKKVKNYR